MSANQTRIYVRFKTEEDFAALGLPTTPDSDNRGGLMEGAISFGGEMILDECSLGAFVEVISAQVGETGIILADTTNWSVDPFAYCVFYLGGKVRRAFFGYGNVETIDGFPTEEYDFYGESEKADLTSRTDIRDVFSWLEYGGFELSDEEREIASLVAAEPEESEEYVFDDDSDPIWEVFPDEYEFVKNLLEGKNLSKPVDEQAKELLEEYLDPETCFLGAGELYMPFFDGFESFTAFATKDIEKRFSK